RRRIDGAVRESGGGARSSELADRAGIDRRRGLGAQLARRRERDISSGGRGWRRADCPRAAADDRTQYLSDATFARRALPPPPGGAERQVLSGEHERGLWQESQADVDGGGRSGLWRDHAPPLVLWGEQGDRRIPDARLRPA